jgi:hypothetical protein
MGVHFATAVSDLYLFWVRSIILREMSGGRDAILLREPDIRSAPSSQGKLLPGPRRASEFMSSSDQRFSAQPTAPGGTKER